MRRIIERVVTIVTTTTWKISWESDPPQASPQAETVSAEILHLEVVPESTLPGPTMIEAKEVDETKTNDIHEPNGG